MEQVLTVLKSCKLFQGLSEDLLRNAVLPQGVLREYVKRQIIFSPPHQVDRFGVVIEGDVHIFQSFADGSSSLLDILHPSYVLGMDLIFTPTRRSPYFAAAAGFTRVAFFPAQLLSEPGHLPEGDRVELLQRLLLMLSQENMHKCYRLSILSQRKLRTRILTYLTMQARKQGADTFQIPFSREELADFLCVNRSALSHELSLMQQEGLIQFWKNQFTLLEAAERNVWESLE